MMIKSIATALLFVMACCAVASATDAVQAAQDRQITQDEYGCTIERYSIYSPAMDKQVNIAVVLPPGYDKDKQATYPIIYTLHGARAPYDTFANMSRLRKMLAEMPMIYTCFEAELSSYLDWPENPKMKYDTFFFKEFIPYIDSNYRTSGQRGVGGFSMGGSGAMYYTLKNPELFTATCVMSSGIRQYVGEGIKGNYRFGDYENHQEFYKSIDAHVQIARHVNRGVKLPTLMLMSGTEDRATQGLRKFRDHIVELNGQMSQQEYDRLTDIPEGRERWKVVNKNMDARRIDFIYIEQPGAHNWAYWHGQAPEFARFFWQEFQKSNNH